MKKQSFLVGSAILMASAAAVKILGAVFKIPLANMLGGTGMGYFSCAYGVFMPVYAVSVTGLPTAVAAVTAGGKVLSFLACPFDALGSTMATYGAQNVGASRYDRLNRGLFAASAMGFAYSVLAFAIAWFFGPSLTQLFVTGGSEELIRLSQQYMVVNVVFYPMLTLVNVVRFMIQGMGFSAFAILAGVMEMFARGACGIWLVPLWGFFGASLGGPLAWIFADAFLIPAYFRCRRTLMSHAHHLNAAAQGAPGD